MLATACANVTVSSPSATSSSVAATVTVCAVAQSTEVNVNSSSALRDVPDNVTPLPAWPLTVTTTSPAGSEPSFTA